MAVELPMARAAPPRAAASEEALAAAWTATERRKRWRRVLLPVAGGAALLLVWWALVAILHVRPFIAPSPLVVAITFYQKFDMLMANLGPTALEALSGFVVGNVAAIVIATVFVHRKHIEQAFFPIAVLLHRSRWWQPRRSWCCCWATDWRRKYRSPRSSAFSPRW